MSRAPRIEDVKPAAHRATGPEGKLIAALCPRHPDLSCQACIPQGNRVAKRRTACTQERGDQGRRSQHAPQLAHQQAFLGQRQAHAALRFGNSQAKPTQFRDGLPDLVREFFGLPAQLVEARERQLALEEARGLVDDGLLFLVGE